jgi:hypothetical protein
MDSRFFLGLSVRGSDIPVLPGTRSSLAKAARRWGNPLPLVAFSLLLLLGARGNLCGQTEYWPQIAGRFNLNTRLSASGYGTLHVREIQANETRLAFLAFPGPTYTGGVLGSADLGGRIAWTVSIGDEEAMDFVIEPSGNTLLLSALLVNPPAGTPRLRVYDRTGRLAGEVEEPDIFRLVVAGNATYGVTSGGFLKSLATGEMRQVTSPDRLRSAFVLPQSGERIRIVDRVDATIVVADVKSGPIGTQPITHAEATRVKELNRRETMSRKGDLRGITVVAADSDADGNLYCLLSGYKPEEGALVLVVDPSGQSTRALRLKVIHGDRGKVGVPLSLAVASAQLLLLDSTGSVTAYYLSNGTKLR